MMKKIIIIKQGFRLIYIISGILFMYLIGVIWFGLHEIIKLIRDDNENKY